MIGNSPSSHTLLRLEARKSFALGIRVLDRLGRDADLTGCSLRLVIKAEETASAPNLVAADANAVIELPLDGFGLFRLQAATLDIEPREYPFAIVLTTAEGYTSVIVKGSVEIVQNVDFDDSSVFTLALPTQTITAELGSSMISVYTGAQLPPGFAYVREERLETIESFDPSAVAYTPAGGRAGYALTKLTGDDYAMDWRPQGNGTFALDATNIDRGFAPASQGDGTWDWQAVGIDATDVAAGWAPVAQGDDTWEWAPVSVAKPDWNAAVGADGEILNKPTLGTAAAKNTGDFIGSTTLLSALPGVQFRTTVPTPADLPEGHIAFVYTV